MEEKETHEKKFSALNAHAEEEISAKEKRVRAITALYYSNPNVQNAILQFSAHREVVPRYFEGFGKRPDTLQYVSDIHGLVKKGATSFHASEELWHDPLQLNSEMNLKELEQLRKSWDLLIDIDSPFLDCSKIAARLIIEALEQHGVRNYGIKFSGSKGFHLIVSGKSFPKEFDGQETVKMFPEWPRAICGYLMDYIRKDYNRLASDVLTNVSAITERTKISKEKLEEVKCGQCGRAAQKGAIVKYVCPVCNLEIRRKNAKVTKRRLKCLDNSCSGVLEQAESEDLYYCEYCKDPENLSLELDSRNYPEKFEKSEGISAEKIAYPDLVLVASRHLFRMPYSLHEKTALASVVLTKEEIENFTPKDADPMKVKIRNYIPEPSNDEARRLLAGALDWARGRMATQKTQEDARFAGIKEKKYAEVELKNVSEDAYPPSIKKLLKGLQDGRKRGLFVLITFLRGVGLSPEELNKKVREWNEKNDPPLKEGYVRSQIEWNLRQSKKIMPPNYSNDAFYRDIGILDKKPESKNPLGDVMRKIRH